MPPLFCLRKVRKIRQGYELDIPQLDIEKGATLAVTGPSGCGKSTALDVLGMVLRPEQAELFTVQAGDATLDVAACWRDGRQDRLAAARLAHVGYVLQTGGLLPFLNVRENMSLGAELLGQADCAERVTDLACRMGIKALLDAMPGRLSIGERQRVAIGRALVTRPALLLADEPTAALDPRHAETVLALFLETVTELGVTLLLVTHDPNLVKRHGLHELRMRMEQGHQGASRAVLES